MNKTTERERCYIRFHFARFFMHDNNWGEDHHYQRQGSFDGRTDREDDQGGGRIRWWGQEGEGKVRWKSNLPWSKLDPLGSLYKNKGQLIPWQGGFVEYSMHSLDCCFNCSGARLGPDPKKMSDFHPDGTPWGLLLCFRSLLVMNVAATV